MIRLYPFVVMIQIFCLYHAYTKKSDHKWLWIIIIFPLIGSLIYLYDQFYNRNNLDIIKEEVKGSLIQNYSINKLEQKLKYSDTYANKLELADEHLRIGNYDRAIEIFESCNSGTYKGDVQILMRLIQSYYLKENYYEVVKYGKLIDGKKEFAKTSERTAFAWSTFRLGEVEKADKIFRSMDVNFSNYKNRLEYIYFLQEAKGNSKAKMKMEELMEEIQAMDSYEKRVHKKVIREIKYFQGQLSKQS